MHINSQHRQQTLLNSKYKFNYNSTKSKSKLNLNWGIWHHYAFHTMCLFSAIVRALCWAATSDNNSDFYALRSRHYVGIAVWYVTVLLMFWQDFTYALELVRNKLSLSYNVVLLNRITITRRIVQNVFVSTI